MSLPPSRGPWPQMAVMYLYGMAMSVAGFAADGYAGVAIGGAFGLIAMVCVVRRIHWADRT